MLLDFGNGSDVTNESVFVTERPAGKLYHVTPGFVTLLSILYGAISVVTIIGNALIILVIINNRAMHTVTNFFIANLSVADVIIGLFSIPFQFQAALLQRWDLPTILCPVAPFVKELSVNVSVLTLVVISVDRFFAVIHPLKKRFSRRLAQVIMSVVWFLGIVSSIPSAVVFRVTMELDDNYEGNLMTELSRYKPFCSPHYPKLFDSVDTGHIYRLYLIIVQYFLPLAAISYAYTRIVVRIWSLKAPGTPVDSRDLTRNRNKRKVVKMMITVVVLFACCWLPLQIYNLLSEIWSQVNSYTYINIIWFSFNWLAMSNSCCNPFIYGLLNEKFKRGFVRLFRRCFCLSADGRRAELDRSFTTNDAHGHRSPNEGQNNVAYHHRSSPGITSEAEITFCSTPASSRSALCKPPSTTRVVDLGHHGMSMSYVSPRGDNSSDN